MIPIGASRLEGAHALAERLIRDDSRRFFIAFCNEVVRFPGDVRFEATPFEVRFDSETGFRASATPYRELFLVSIGHKTPCSLRVSSEDDFYAALDLALQHFLECASR